MIGRTLIRRAWLLCGLLAGGPISVAGATQAATSPAAEAFARGDYARAEAEWKPAAERGEAEAQFGMGEVLEQGRGDYLAAARWYRKAAEQGSAPARYRLALLYLTGNRQFIPSISKGYMWLLLATSGDNPDPMSDELRRLVEAHISGPDQAEGQREMEAWQRNTRVQRHGSPPAQTPGPQAALPEAPATPSAPPGPPLQLPPPQPLPQGPPPQVAAPPVPAAPQALPETPASPPAAPPVPASPRNEQLAFVPPKLDLGEELQKLPCSALMLMTAADGKRIIQGTIPGDSVRDRIAKLIEPLPPQERPELAVEVLKPPLCRSLGIFNQMRKVGLVFDDGIEAEIPGGNPVQREGTALQVRVRARTNYPVEVRIDYFMLDGSVLHMWPNPDLPKARIMPGKTELFNRRDTQGRGWEVAGPFGTEFIAVIATPKPLDLGVRQQIEDAGDYMRDLQAALNRQVIPPEQSNEVATLIIHTAPK